MYTHKGGSQQANVCANAQKAQEKYIFVLKSIVPFITDVPSQAHAVMGPPETRCVTSEPL